MKVSYTVSYDDNTGIFSVEPDTGSYETAEHEFAEQAYVDALTSEVYYTLYYTLPCLPGVRV
jgi:hypothetical protein